MKNIIFDLDGTLIDSVLDIAKYVNLTREKYGLQSLSVDAVRKNLGNGAEKLIKDCIPEIPYKKEILDYYNEEYTACDFSSTTLFDGVKEMLERLKDRYTLILISNKPEQTVNQIIKKFFKGVFTYVFGGKEGVPLKPSKELFLEIQNKTGIKAEETFMVGDGETDYLFAVNNNLKPISVCYGYRDEAFLRSYGATNFAYTVFDVEKKLNT